MASDSLSTAQGTIQTPTATPGQRDMIVVENLWKTYDMGSEQQVSALHTIEHPIDPAKPLPA